MLARYPAAGLVADPWTQWDHIASDDDDDALGDDDHDVDRPLSGTPSTD